MPAASLRGWCFSRTAPSPLSARQMISLPGLVRRHSGAISEPVAGVLYHEILPGSGHNLRSNRPDAMWRLLAMTGVVWLGPPDTGPAQAVICLQLPPHASRGA